MICPGCGALNLYDSRFCAYCGIDIKSGGIPERYDITECRKELKTKEILLKEIHHRVKNNMQMISSLIWLQSEYCKDETSKQLFQNTRNRIKSLALIHEKLSQSENPKKVDFQKYMESIVKWLLQSI